MRRAYRWGQENVATVALTALGLGAVAAFLAASAVYTNIDQGDRITRVERSACNRAPDSKACAKVREKVARAEPIKNACIPYQRVTGERGRNCPRGFTRQRGEVVPQKPSNPPARQQPGPGSDRGDGNERPAPRSPRVVTPTPTAPKPSQPAPVIVNPPPVPSTPAPSPPAPIRETVEGVTDTACQVTQPVTGICLK